MEMWENKVLFRNSDLCASEQKCVPQGTEMNRGKDNLKNVGAAPLEL